MIPHAAQRTLTIKAYLSSSLSHTPVTPSFAKHLSPYASTPSRQGEDGDTQLRRPFATRRTAHRNAPPIHVVLLCRPPVATAKTPPTGPAWGRGRGVEPATCPRGSRWTPARASVRSGPRYRGDIRGCDRISRAARSFASGWCVKCVFWAAAACWRGLGECD